MTTWRLWRDLRDPPRHELRRWPNRPASPWSPRRPSRPWLLILLVAGLIGLGLLSRSFLLAGLVLLAVLPFALLILNGTLLGLFWAIEISAGVRRWSSPRAWPLWQASPDGALGIAWQGALARLYRDSLMAQSYRLVRSVTLALGLVMIFSALLVGVSQTSAAGSQDSDWLVTDILPVLVGCIVLYLDHVQSVTLGCLVGLHQARSAGPVAELTVRAAVEYGIVKGFTLLLLALIYATIQTASSPLGAIGSDLLLYLTLPLIWFGVHEGLLTLYWQIVRTAYDFG